MSLFVLISALRMCRKSLCLWIYTQCKDTLFASDYKKNYICLVRIASRLRPVPFRPDNRFRLSANIRISESARTARVPRAPIAICFNIRIFAAIRVFCFLYLPLIFILSSMSIEQAISEGILFKPEGKKDSREKTGVKTKAKKTTYIKGAHGSGAAKMKAEFRRQRANRHKK